TESEEVPFTGYTKLFITSPSNEQSITTGQPTVDVSVATEPSLQKNHKIQIIFDGVAKGQPQAAYNFSLSDLTRGAHEIFFRVLDENDNT
ncbi:unnamed protein product, partial [marine sediment metagenome]